MTAGLNCRFNVWRISTPTDDNVGGAVVTGTVVYYYIQARLHSVPSQQILLQQGLETEETFTAIVVPGNLDIRERDEIEDVAPYNSYYYGKRFRVTGSRHTDFAPDERRSYITLNLRRSEEAHNEQ